MAARTFQEGYRDGWMSIAGDAPLPENPTQPPADEQRSFENGFLYGRGDAAERFQPDGTPLRTG